MNPSHDNTQDSADLEIARLKEAHLVELVGLKERLERAEAHRDEFWAEIRHGGVADGVEGAIEELSRRVSEAEAELSRLTEERDRLRAALKLLVGSIHQNKSLNDAFVCSDEEALDNARAILGTPSKTEET